MMKTIQRLLKIDKAREEQINILTEKDDSTPQVACQPSGESEGPHQASNMTKQRHVCLLCGWARAHGLLATFPV